MIALANKPLRPCRHPGCGRLVSSGYCPEHKPLKAARRVSAQWHGWYNLSVWTKQLRPDQLMREPFCRECARHGKRVQATVVDHITPFRGDWALFIDPANHESLCETCHNRKTAKEMAAERRKNGR
ncbi:MAG: HNH endonuclease [Flavonifractor plautii]|nr:HNH endonuclease [Flavonifractor plautii]